MTTYGVYTGRWTDYSKGATLGDQLTLTGGQSNALIAAIAVTNSVIGSLVWQILCRSLHQFRVRKPDPQTAFFHQTQAILRNSPEPTSFTAKMMLCASSWKAHLSREKISTIFSLTAPAIIIFSAFTLAGLYLSQIFSKGDVLLRTSKSGMLLFGKLNLTNEEHFKLYEAINVEMNQDMQVSKSYAQACYESSTKAVSTNYNRGTALNCNFFSKPTFDWDTKYVDECPFGDLCTVPRALRLDAGTLDSSDDLGINAPLRNRIQVHRTMTCSPINAQRHSTNGFVEDPQLGDTAQYFFGHNRLQSEVAHQPYRANVTFLYSHDTYSAPSSAYQLGVATEDAKNLGFNPIEELRSPGKLSLFFLANRARYIDRVDDPLYNATTQDVHSELWYNPEPIGILGCVEEDEVCNPIKGKCLPTKGLIHAHSEGYTFDLDALDMNSIQRDTTKSVLSMLISASAGLMAYYIGSQSLVANDFLLNQVDMVSIGLPERQWEIEVQRIQAMRMSAMQRLLFVNLGGPSSPIIHKYLTPFRPGTGFHYISRNYKIKNFEYSNFSVLALGLIFGFDAFVMLFWTIVKLLIPWIRRRWGTLSHQDLGWASDSYLQTHRGLYQLLDRGEWTGQIWQTVPRTVDDDKFYQVLSIEEFNTDRKGNSCRDEEKAEIASKGSLPRYKRSSQIFYNGDGQRGKDAEVIVQQNSNTESGVTEGISNDSEASHTIGRNYDEDRDSDNVIATEVEHDREIAES